MGLIFILSLIKVGEWATVIAEHRVTNKLVPKQPYVALMRSLTYSGQIELRSMTPFFTLKPRPQYITVPKPAITVPITKALPISNTFNN